MAEWLRSGLQNRLHQFNSGRGLHPQPIQILQHFLFAFVRPKAGAIKLHPLSSCAGSILDLCQAKWTARSSQGWVDFINRKMPRAARQARKLMTRISEAREATYGSAAAA